MPDNEMKPIPLEWPEPKILNPDIPAPTGVLYIDSLLHRLLDAQQDINLEANSRMSQSLCDASALIDEIETTIRKLSAWNARATAQSAGGGVETEDAIRKAADALVRQLSAVINRLEGQAYSSTLSQMNELKAALSARAVLTDTAREGVGPAEQWEYRTVEGPRKGENPGPPEGDGWMVDADRGRVGTHQAGWDRFDYHEEYYWARRIVPTAPSNVGTGEGA